MEEHVRHARAMAAVVASALEGAPGGTGTGPGPARFADLGSGGGVPALILLDRWSESKAVLVEVMARRAAFLREAVVELGWVDRVEILEERAELTGRRPARRAGLSLVTARSFGRPAVTAECAAPLLAPGGWLVVSEPPLATDRWPREGLALLGMQPSVRADQDGYHFQLVLQVNPCSDRFPRRIGVPERRPLF